MSVMGPDEIEVDYTSQVDSAAFRRMLMERWADLPNRKREKRRRKRQLAVYYLSLDGWSFSQIGEAFHLDKSTVCRFIQYVQASLVKFFHEINFDPEDVSMSLAEEAIA